MDEAKLKACVEAAAKECGCSAADVILDEDNNIEVMISRESSPVGLQDCEFVHRAVLKAFDRDIEDYSLTVSSQGISAEEADKLLKEETIE
jgi:ribosome maturation factor RimP